MIIGIVINNTIVTVLYVMLVKNHTPIHDGGGSSTSGAGSNTIIYIYRVVVALLIKK